MELIIRWEHIDDIEARRFVDEPRKAGPDHLSGLAMSLHVGSDCVLCLPDEERVIWRNDFARVISIFDEGKRIEIGQNAKPVDFLRFVDSKKYKDRLLAAQKSTSESDALLVQQGTIKGISVVCAAFEFSFLGGSMGSVVGERFAAGVRRSCAKKIPFVCFSESGGARMQEGLTSLMQMAKTTAAISQLSAQGLPFISVLTDPTMGGVSASFAMVGDVVIAEPGALIGFAGPRVIEQTVRQTLPDGFQRSEFLLEHGAIDMIIDRREMKDRLANLLSLFTRIRMS